jgi:hypothetical protein
LKFFETNSGKLAIAVMIGLIIFLSGLVVARFTGAELTSPFFYSSILATAFFYGKEVRVEFSLLFAAVMAGLPSAFANSSDIGRSAAAVLTFVFIFPAVLAACLLGKGYGALSRYLTSLYSRRRARRGAAEL